MKQSRKNYRCIIVDDDPNFIFLLSNYLKEVPKLALIKFYLNPVRAIDDFDSFEDIDFLFLDIRMGNSSGLDVAVSLRPKVKYIVFITGCNQFALDAFQAGGDQYLVKPVFFSKFLDTINNIIRKEYKNNLPRFSPQHILSVPKLQRN